MFATATSLAGNASRSDVGLANSIATSFRRAVAARHLDRDRVEIDREDRREPELARRRRRRHPSRSRRRGGLPRSSRDRSSMQARVVGCAAVPNARPGRRRPRRLSPAGGSIHGGPIQSATRPRPVGGIPPVGPPSRLDGLRVASGKRRGSPRRRRPVVHRELRRVASTRSSKPCGACSTSHARAISAVGGRNEGGDATEPLSEARSSGG